MKLDDVVALPEFAANPFPYYREMQEAAPVQWSETWKCWVVTRYDDVRACLQDFKRFSNVGRITGLFRDHFDSEQLAELRPLIDHYTHGLINVDPPEHSRLRQVLHEVFKPSTIERLAGLVREAARDLLAPHLQAGRIDAVREFTHPLPVRVIAGLFGVPGADVHLFANWSAEIVAFMQSPKPEIATCLRSQKALLGLRAYLSQAIALRRREPSNDVLSLMVAAQSDGAGLTDEEILGTSVTILLGGHETTTRLLGTILHELLRQPEKQVGLRGFTSIPALAIEELLRHCGPFQRDQRVAIVETELGGQRIRRGDFILLMLAAANRDPRQFAAPEKLDFLRKPNRHLAFGFGPHICLGAHLARLEVSIALAEFLGACRNLRLARDSVDWEFGFLRGPRELSLTFSNEPHSL